MFVIGGVKVKEMYARFNLALPWSIVVHVTTQNKICQIAVRGYASIQFSSPDNGKIILWITLRSLTTALFY